MNVILCGFQGAGKTSWGRRLAERVGAIFIDTDALILERCPGANGCAEVVAEEGLEGFRELEREVIEGLKGVKGAVIALGGGAPESAQVREWVRELGVVVYLKMSRKEVVARSRLQFEGAESVWERRQALYEEVADRIVMSEEELEAVWIEAGLESCLK